MGQHVPSALLHLAKAANRVTIGTVASIPNSSYSSDKAGGEQSRIATVVERMRTRGREWADDFIDKNRIGIPCIYSIDFAFMLRE